MNDDWYDLLVALVGADVRFLVVGAHAVALHGHVRATQDLDVWVDPTPENADRVWQALRVFGAPAEALGISRGDFATPGMVMQFGLPPNRIDVLTSVSGLASFAVAWEGRAEHVIRGTRVPFIGREALMANKRATGRPKDHADLTDLGDDGA
ncbi:MAG: hypothetical protein MUF53_08445 [Gemmatimonadaceae bacterium]|jgi:hypothetical protein|nr:hypothetical protein [Gemmatimonadaceae bacterium]